MTASRKRRIRDTSERYWKNLELERADHSATPCAVERKKEGNARSDESEVEMADDDGNDSQALTGGYITKYSALVARISDLSQGGPDLKALHVCCAMASPSVLD